MAGCPEADVRFDKRIYNAPPEQLLDVLREADEDANVVMLVGHAPGIPALASVLADGEGSAAAHGALAQGCPRVRSGYSPTRAPGGTSMPEPPR